MNFDLMILGDFESIIFTHNLLKTGFTGGIWGFRTFLSFSLLSFIGISVIRHPNLESFPENVGYTCCPVQFHGNLRGNTQK